MSLVLSSCHEIIGGKWHAQLTHTESEGGRDHRQEAHQREGGDPRQVQIGDQLHLSLSIQAERGQLRQAAAKNRPIIPRRRPNKATSDIQRRRNRNESAIKGWKSILEKEFDEVPMPCTMWTGSLMSSRCQ